MSKTFELLKNFVDQEIIPGFCASIIDGTQIKHSFYGNKSKDEAISSLSLMYDIASLTKLFTTTRILQMVQEGILSLDTPVSSILSDFKNSDITINNLLLHNSGFAASAKGRYTLDAHQLRKSILKCDDLVAEVGAETVYSCINFVILGFIIEELDGNLETSFELNIYQKCGMTHTQFGPVLGDVAPSKIIDGVEIKGTVSDTTAKVLNGISGNAGLFSNLIDLEKFVLGYMNRVLLNDDMLSLLKDMNVNSRTLGWNLLFNQTGHLYHTGFTGPSIYLDLDQNISFIIMTNRNIQKNADEYIVKRNEVLSQFIQEFSR